MSYKVLDLFSGIGGFSLGLERAGMETIAFCEFDEHARKVLNKHWPNVPIHKDVRVLDGKQYRGAVDVVCGGFPCQDLSTAGKRKGFDGERSSLYREMLRIISDCRPRWAIFENVTGLLNGDTGRWFSEFLNDLAKIGYDAEWHCISASELGAHHHRDRIWIIAYPTKLTWNEQKARIGSKVFEQTIRFKKLGGLRDKGFDKKQNGLEGFVLKSGFCRRNNGFSEGVDRLARLGNAVVPQIPELIGRAIIEFEKKTKPQ